MTPDPSRMVLAPQLHHALVHDRPPEGGEQRQEDAAGVAHRQLLPVVFCFRGVESGVRTRLGRGGVRARRSRVSEGLSLSAAGPKEWRGAMLFDAAD